MGFSWPKESSKANLGVGSGLWWLRPGKAPVCLVGSGWQRNLMLETIKTTVLSNTKMWHSLFYRNLLITLSLKPSRFGFCSFEEKTKKWKRINWAGKQWPHLQRDPISKHRKEPWQSGSCEVKETESCAHNASHCAWWWYEMDERTSLTQLASKARVSKLWTAAKPTSMPAQTLKLSGSFEVPLSKPVLMCRAK